MIGAAFSLTAGGASGSERIAQAAGSSGLSMLSPSVMRQAQTAGAAREHGADAEAGEVAAR